MENRHAGYRLDRLVHRGEHTEVWAGRAPGPTDRAVALKRVRDLTDPHEQRIARIELRAEAERLSVLSHPNIVPILEVLDEPLAIVTPWFSGGTLRNLLVERGALTAGQLAAILVPIVEALDGLAAAGLAHGDLKPANILLDHHGIPHLADLGSARPLGGVDDPAASGGTRDGPLRSSPAYLDPHVVETGAPSATGDVWSLGVIAYEVLTGRLPHRGEPAEILALAAAGAHRPLTDRPAVPTAVAEVVETALDPEPQRRPPHPGVFCDRLLRVLPVGEVIELPGPAKIRDGGPASPDHRTVAIGPFLAPEPEPRRRSLGGHRSTVLAAALLLTGGVIDDAPARHEVPERVPVRHRTPDGEGDAGRPDASPVRVPERGGAGETHVGSPAGDG